MTEAMQRRSDELEAMFRAGLPVPQDDAGNVAVLRDGMRQIVQWCDGRSGLSLNQILFRIELIARASLQSG